jgi:putative ABC transport system permease protein
VRAIKHAILSLLRKPAKAVMIFVIISVVYGLVFTGIIIQNSVKSSKEYVRKELGAVVSMTTDAVKVINQRMTGAEFKRLELPVSVANEIAKDPMVKELFITQTANVSNADLKSAVDMGNENGGGFTLKMNRDGQDGSSFTLVGSSSDTPLEFYNGTYQITQGHLRSSADASKDTLIVSDEFASMNNLSVGSLVELANRDGDSYTFEVIGTFSGSETYMVDQMYSSLDSVYKLSGIQAGAESASSISFLLNDPLDVDQFISRHEAELPNDYLVLDANDSEYESLTRPLDLISTITSILLVVVFIAGALIMLAIITIFVRDRRNEIGLLLSSGEGRIKIVLQFILEILMVSVLSFLLAAGTSRFSSDYVADWIVKNQLVEDNTDSSMNMAGGIRIGRIGGPAVTADNQIQISDVADEFNVEIDGGVVVRLLLLSFGLVILSAGAPLMIILGYKPRESLQD